MKKTLNSKLPDNIVSNSGYSAVRLKDKFNIKNKTVKEHQHGIIYCVECPEENCKENCVGETGRGLSERVVDHNSRYKNSHIVFKSLVSWEVFVVRTNFAEK